MDEIMALPYLDMVVKETLRVHSPVPFTGRIATEDDIIPLNKPFTDRDGNVHDSIAYVSPSYLFSTTLLLTLVHRVAKGDPVMIPILIINRSKALWGEDSFEFRSESCCTYRLPYSRIVIRPERWENLPEAVSGIPGVWGNLLSFLGGPRSCIGYRFSLVEYVPLLLLGPLDPDHISTG